MPFNQRELRAEFWRQHPRADRRTIPSHDGKGRMYRTDTRVAWCDFIDAMCRAGEISPELAERATLMPARHGFEFEIEGNFGQGWECVTTETTRQDARRSLREYRENDPSHAYRIQRRRVVLSQGE